MQSRRCPTCDRVWLARRTRCPVDGALLGPPAADAGGEALLGRTIRGRYTIEGRIGLGGHGAVYLARQLSVDRDVAIKLLKEDASKSEALVRRFEREARIVARLRHPNTVRVHDHGRTADGRLFLVTEFLEGRPLDAVLADGPLGESLTLDLLTAVCGSLAEAHESGVVHRDLKPGNIFLARVAGEPVFKVLDFGIAKLDADVTLTAGGDIFGTPAYIAPEQARGAAVDDRTDLYSLGVVAYECLSGARPFDAPNGMGLLIKHLNEAPPPFPDAVEVSPALRDLVFGMLEKQADARPPSARTVRDMVATITLNQSLPKRTAVTPIVAGDRPVASVVGAPARRRSRVPAVALVAALLGAAGIWLALSVDGATPEDATPAPPGATRASIPSAAVSTEAEREASARAPAPVTVPSTRTPRPLEPTAPQSGVLVAPPESALGMPASVRSVGSEAAAKGPSTDAPTAPIVPAFETEVEAVVEETEAEIVEAARAARAMVDEQTARRITRSARDWEKAQKKRAKKRWKAWKKQRKRWEKSLKRGRKKKKGKR